MRGSSYRHNPSFVSNQQLIESMRNKASRSLSRNKSQQSNISLIEPRNHPDAGTAKFGLHSGMQSKENTNPNTRRTSRKRDGQREKVDSSHGGLVGFLRSNISNKKLLTQAEKLIQALPDTPQVSSGGLSKQEAALMAKIQSLYLDKTRLKKEKKALEHKLKDQAAQYEAKLQQMKRQNERLHKLVLKQSELITNQSQVQVDPADDLRKILVAQAKTIEALQTTQNNRRNASFMR